MPYYWSNVNKLRIVPNWAQQPPENFICVCVFNADSCNAINGAGHVHCACLFCKYLVWATPKNDKNASSVPKVITGKWPVCLGQKEGQLKKVVGVFPITTRRWPVDNNRTKGSVMLHAHLNLQVG